VARCGARPTGRVVGGPRALEGRFASGVAVTPGRAGAITLPCYPPPVSYDWLRALHIIGVVTWFAALFYIFRLYVYHVENRDERVVTGLLATMERRLYRGIAWPAMLLTTVFGVLLWSRNFSGYLASGWFHAKLGALVFLFGYHFYCGKVRRDLAADRCRLTSRQCRLINEVPTVLLLVIVTMAVVKPF
jgi:protoporphyrinogen IX oxidase